MVSENGDRMTHHEVAMVDEARSIDLNISDHYFRLTTEGIRLFSNKESRYTTLDEVVDSRASHAGTIARAYEADDLKKHLKLIPADGSVAINLTISETSASTIEDAIPLLEEAIGSSVRFAEAVSLLLFDWIVERQSTEIVMKLGLTAEEEEIYRHSYRRRPE
jgi:hypothetical protein